MGHAGRLPTALRVRPAVAGLPFAAGQDLLPFPLYIKGTVLAYYTLSGILLF